MTAMGAFAWLVSATLMGLALSALGAAAIYALRGPARRVRAIEFTLLACLVAPWLPAAPGLPRVEWLELLASNAPSSLATEAPNDAAASPEIIAPIESPAAVVESSVASPGEALVALDAESDRALELGSMAAPSPADHEPVNTAPIEAESTEPGKPLTSVAATTSVEAVTVPKTQLDDLEAVAVSISWPAIAVGVYLAGTALVLLLDALGGLALLRVHKGSKHADAQVQSLLTEIAGPNGGRVSLLISSRCRQPFTFAWLWPVIVLPPALVVPGKERELRWALAHEWSHVANRHTWGWALAGFARAIYWPQPFVWQLRRRLRLEQDFIADAQAAGTSANAPEYATFLTAQAAHAQRLSLGLGIAGGKSELARRVVMLVQGKRLVSARCGWKWSAAFGVLGALMLLAVGSMANAFLPVDEVQAAQTKKPEIAAAPADVAGDRSDKAQAQPTNGAIRPFDQVKLQVTGLPFPRAADPERIGQFIELWRTETIDQDGRLNLGARYGRVAVVGLNLAQAEARIIEHIQKAVDEDIAAGRAVRPVKPLAAQLTIEGHAHSMSLVDVSKPPRLIQVGEPLKIDAIGFRGSPPRGEYVVEPQGTVALGPSFGRVEVAGLTTEAAGERIYAQLAEIMESALPRISHQPEMMVWVSYPDETLPETKLVPLPAADYRIQPGNHIAIEALGPDLLPKLRGAGLVDAQGKLSLRQANNGRWRPGIDAELPVANLTSTELESAVRAALGKAGPIAWLTTEIGSFDARQPAGKEAGASPSVVESDERIRPFDMLSIQIANVPRPRNDQGAPREWNASGVVDADGAVAINARYGRVSVSGLTIEEAEKAILEAVVVDNRQDVSRGLADSNGPPAVQVVRAGRANSLEIADVSASTEKLSVGERVRLEIDPLRFLVADDSIELPAVRTDSIVEASGLLPLGPRYGRVEVDGLDRQRAIEAARRQISSAIDKAYPSVAPFNLPAGVVDLFYGSTAHNPSAFIAPPNTDYQLRPGNLLLVEVLDTQLVRLKLAYFSVQADGTIGNVAPNGRVGGDLEKPIKVAGLSLLQTEETIAKELELASAARIGYVSVQLAGWSSLPPGATGGPSPFTTGQTATSPLIEANSHLRIVVHGALPDQPIDGTFLIDPDGVLSLGPHYGSVKLHGLTLEQARQRIAQKLERLVREPDVVIAFADGGDRPPKPRPNLRYSGKSFDQWREVLENDLDPETRAEALKALGKFGANGMAQEAAEAIVPFIGHRIGDEQVVYFAAVESLRQLGEPGMPAVVAALANPDERIRKSAASLLAQLPADAAALAALDKALDDKSPTVRVSVAEALAAHKRDLERAGQALEKAFETGDDPSRTEIAEVLMRRFPPTDARLRIASDYLDRADPRERPQYLGPAGTKNAEFMVPLMALRLEKALAGLPPERTDQRRHAPENINRINEQVVRPLLYLQRAGPEAMPALPTVLKLTERSDLASFLGGYVLQVLRTIGPAAATQAQPALQRLRVVSDRNYQGQIDELLRSWGEQPAEPGAKPQDAQPEKAAEARRLYSGKTFAEWETVLEEDLDPAAKIEAITALGKFGASGRSREAAAALSKCLGNPGSAVVENRRETVGRRAAEALAALGPSGIPTLMKSLEDESSAVRRDAVFAFVNVGNAAAPAAELLAAIAKADANNPPAERYDAAFVISSITSRPEVTLPILKMLVHDSDLELRNAGFRGLSSLEIPDEEAVALIVDALGTPPKNRASLQAATAGGSVQRKLKVLEHMLRQDQKSPEDRLNMLHAVMNVSAGIGPEAGPLVPLLTQAVEASDELPGARVTARQRYVDTLEKMGAGAKSALPYLRTLQDDPSQQAAKRAIQVIEQSR